MSYLQTQMAATGESSSPQKHHESIKKSGWWGAKVKLFVLVVGLMVGGGLFKGVEAQIDPLRDYRPSPQAASLIDVPEVSMDYYTGNPGFEKTLHVIETPNIELPITLSHDGRAVKPTDRPSWVGLGWSLSAGGVVTRSVRGQPDNKRDGFVYSASEIHRDYHRGLSRESGALYDEYEDFEIDNPAKSVKVNAPISWHYRRWHIEEGEGFPYDMEPDSYFYEFGERSGRFMIDADTDTTVGPTETNGTDYRTMPMSDYDVQKASRGWIIKRANGNEYIFGDSDSSIERSNYPRFSAKTAWYLTSINNRYGKKELDIKYDGFNMNYHQPPSKRIHEVHPENEECALSEDEQIRSEIIEGRAFRLVERIVTSTEIVEFMKSKRQDMLNPYGDDGGAVDEKQMYKLDRLVVYNNEGSLGSPLKGNAKKTVLFDYSYFETDVNTDEYGQRKETVGGDRQWPTIRVSGKRLRLDAVQIIGDNEPIPPYEFEYYHEDEELLERYSRDVDHWGYPNGVAINEEIVPERTISPRGYTWDVTLGSADREPTQNINVLLPGALKKIKYPSGGYDRFFYELEKYGYKNGISEERKIGGGIRLSKMIRESKAGSRKLKRFKYSLSSGHPSGNLARLPRYKFDSKISGTDTECDVYYGVTSSAITPFGNSASVIGHKKVTILHGPDNEDGEPVGGRTVYRFTTPRINKQHAFNQSDHPPPAPPMQYPWQGGRRVRTTKLETGWQKKIEKETHFSRHVSDSLELDNQETRKFNRVIGAKTFVIPVEYSGGTDPRSYGYSIEWYSVLTGFMYPSSTTITRFGNDGEKTWSKTLTNYHGDPHMQPTIRTVKTSNGLRRTTKYKYAHEKYQGMAYENMMTQKYRTTVFEDADNNGQVGSGETVWKRSWTDWTKNAHRHWVPQSEWVWTEESDQ